MGLKIKSLLSGLSTSDLKKLLAVRERIDVLEEQRGRLVKELAGVDRELAGLLDAVAGTRVSAPARRGRKPAAGKTGRKKVARKKAARTKAGRKAARRGTPRKRAGEERVKLEDVIVSVLKQQGPQLSFPDLYRAIVEGGLYASRSKNFDNVLRRTLSTSALVKRVSRGVYAVA